MAEVIGRLITDLHPNSTVRMVFIANVDGGYQTTRGTLALKLNAENVFEFTVDETIQHSKFGPIFDDHLGEVTRFIEGAWVTEVADFLQKIKAHSEHAWKERNAPKRLAKSTHLRNDSVFSGRSPEHDC